MEPGKFGPYLRDLRIRRGLTQEQVAETLHVSGAAVSKWETGKCLPDLAKLETLAEVLDVSLLDLMRCSTENAPPAARQAMANDPSGPAGRTRRQQIRGAAVLLIFTALVIFLQYFPLHRVALVWQPSWFETGEVSLLAYTGSREDRQTAQPVMALAEQAFSTLGLTRAEAAARCGCTTPSAAMTKQAPCGPAAPVSPLSDTWNRPRKGRGRSFPSRNTRSHLLAQSTSTAPVARSDCAAVGGSDAYGCGVPLAGKRNARREEPVEHW